MRRRRRREETKKVVVVCVYGQKPSPATSSIDLCHSSGEPQGILIGQWVVLLAIALHHGILSLPMGNSVACLNGGAVGIRITLEPPYVNGGRDRFRFRRESSYLRKMLFAKDNIDIVLSVGCKTSRCPCDPGIT